MTTAKKIEINTGLKIDICLGCYASYNEGHLLDRWFTCYDIDDVSDAVELFEKEVLKIMRDKAIKEGRSKEYIDTYYPDHYAEELYLADYEIYFDGEFLDLDFGESIWDLKQWIENDGQYLDSLNNSFGFLVKLKEYLNTDKDLTELDSEVCFYELDGFNTDEALGYEVAEATCMLDGVPESVKGYFNYEQFGYDLIAGGDYFILEFGGVTYAIDNHTV